ncbi:RagB/SusD family nutrient uptake outer membrane protein [Chryseobacterium phocaeense]|uniref:RagB/SusD family nutrient uptake outer membrane protein n=1 Tax=Chryseobacterium phocaeense TaxID=1816690 RepID=UPI0009B9B4AC|nr:RagB/SusD family nutrient uptake outer membrane protein [Chryseobacterium phocaeense]
MKKIIISSILVLSSLSCSNDFLENRVENAVLAEEFFKTEADAMSGTAAIYAFLKGWDNSAFPFQYVMGVTGDDVVKGSNPGDSSFINAYDNYSYTVSDAGIESYWKAQWKGIALCNRVITHVPLIEMNANLRNRLVAEAKFLKAYFYFNLVRLWGGVPIFDNIPVNPSEFNYNIPRNSVNEVYDYIIKNLNEAADVLPQSYPASDLGRVTKGAAKGILSKVYLYKKDWQKAYDTSNEVIAMGYSLDPDFNHLFRIEGEFGTESVFEVNNQCTGAFGGSQYAQVQGVRNQFGWGFFTPSPALENAFEAGDIRKELTILRNGETTPEGDVIAMQDPLSVTTFNQKVYVPKSHQTGCDQGSEQNIRILRFADILLINAEAANELGNISAAATSLNKVRNRATLANTTASNQETMRAAIYQERKVELAMENDRFPDLLRTGQAATVLGPLGFKSGKNELLPIPLNAINDSNGVLTQNPGY